MASKKKQKPTVEEAAKALADARGQVTIAADILDVNYRTLRRMVKRSSTLRAEIDRWKERRVDTAELKLEQALQKGEPWAVQLTLKTQGKRRGYVERQEHEVGGLGGKDIKVKVIYGRNNKR
jgi:hypothetical protein